MRGITGISRVVGACMFAALSTIAHGAEAGASADELLGDATLLLQQIDAGQYATVWQETATFVRAKFTADGFANGLSQSRKAVGAVDHRGWASVTRLIFSHDKAIPDGLYANVDYATWLTDGRVVYEMVSFQLGSDGRWYFTGYAPRLNQGAAPQARVDQKSAQ
ncbi:hypothetical protein C9I57_00715 [Trinickia symbiotica]|uniref:DUF4019 domain-containing protein n=2 Tax=Trinickia symbiotica TaxID=863227 RepID=A0A2T3Y0R1_9BURK|nr:hypothetical protein C9I57_00715 [Trinickia symbiotica]